MNTQKTPISPKGVECLVILHFYRKHASIL